MSHAHVCQGHKHIHKAPACATYSLPSSWMPQRYCQTRYGSNRLIISAIPTSKRSDFPMEPQLSCLASSLLFATAYIAAREGVLETFTNLTTHPVFRAHVKEIVFDSSWIDPATVAEYAKDENEPALAGLFQQQEDIQAFEIQKRLEIAVQCLLNVKTVSYADPSRTSYLPGNCKDPIWNSDYAGGPLIRRLESSDFGSNEIGVCCLMNGRNAECSGHVDNLQYRRRFGGLILLLQVLSDCASTTLQELSLGSYFPSPLNLCSSRSAAPNHYLGTSVLPVKG